MTTKLEIYNMALGYVGERKLASLSEAREPRYVLEQFYANVVDHCLSRGFWNWAMKTVEIEASDEYEPSFGYTKAFEKPSDWMRTFNVSDNENLDPPLLKLIDEGGLWYTNCDPLYVKYVSNDASYGMDLTKWSAAFADYVSLNLALRAQYRLTAKEPSDYLVKTEKRAMQFAMSRDAMDEPPAFPPTGTWTQSRQNSFVRRSRWNGVVS